MCSRFRSIIPLLLLAWLIQTAAAAPVTLSQSVTFEGQTVTMQLTRLDLRGTNFELLSQNADGGYDPIVPVEERSYMGSVDEFPGAISCGVLLDDGTFRGAIYFDRGATWFTLGDQVDRTRGLDYNNFSSYQSPAAPTVSPGQAGNEMIAFDLGVDADHDFYTEAASDIAQALERIEYSVTVVRAIYMRDALLRTYLGRVIIRSSPTQDPYNGLDQGSYLSAVRSEWNINQDTADRDVVAGISPEKIGGGLAYVGTIANDSAYSVSQANSSGAFDVVFRHELGHNWSCGHFVGGRPEGAGLMGGNQPGRLTGCELYRVLRERDAEMAALTTEGVFDKIALPPYASLDAPSFRNATNGMLEIDVLANDHDANGEELSLTAFDSISSGGGTVTQVGRNLVYTAGLVSGSDWFTYQISDLSGQTATGVAVISDVTNRVITGSTNFITRSSAQVDAKVLEPSPNNVTIVWGSEDGGPSIADWENALVTEAQPDGTITANLHSFPSRGSISWNIVANFPEGDMWGTARSFQIPNVTEGITLVPTGILGTTTVPTDSSEGSDWHATSFDDNAWTIGKTGVGYEDSGSNFRSAGLLLTDVVESMNDINGSVYVRVPFTIPDRAALDSLQSLSLQMNYDDGFVAYLNGMEIARANAPLTLDWNSTATANHLDADAEEAVSFDVSGFISQLVVGNNLLAIHGLNNSIGSSDMLILPELTGTNTTATTLVASGASLNYSIPTSSAEEATWFSSTFDASVWEVGRSGIGYEDGSGYEAFIRTDVEDQMMGEGGNTTLWVRIPFNAPDSPLPEQLLLNMNYDDAFVAYLNGVEIARSDNAPLDLSFDASANSTSEEARLGFPELFDVSDHIELFEPGTNVLAIHGLNSSISSSDFLIEPELVLIPPTASKTYAGWLSGFPALEATLPSDDPDADGISNLLEYASGGDPSLNTQSATGQPLLPFVAEEDSTFSITIRRRIDYVERGIQFQIQLSGDLMDWVDREFLESEPIKSPDGVTEFVTYALFANESPVRSSFARLVVRAAP